MRNLSHLLTVVMLSCAVYLSFDVTSSAQNLLRNPGFEGEAFTSYPALYWNSTYDHAGQWGNAIRQNWHVYQGNSAYGIAGQWFRKNVESSGIWQEVPCIAGAQYKFSAWFWADNGEWGSWVAEKQEIKIEFFDSNGVMLSAYTNNIGSVGEAWQEKEIIATAPSGATMVRVVIDVWNAGNDGTLQFDNLVLSQWGSSSWGSNHLLNGYFEQDSDDWAKTITFPIYWERDYPDRHGDCWGSGVSRRDWRSHSGSGYEMTIAGTWLNNVDDEGGVWQEVAASPEGLYTFSGWFWADNGENGIWTAATQQIKIEFLDSSYNRLSTNVQSLGSIGETWVKRSLTAVAPARTAWARVVVKATGIGFSGSLQFDDLELVLESTESRITSADPNSFSGGVRTPVTVSVKNEFTTYTQFRVYGNNTNGWGIYDNEANVGIYKDIWLNPGQSGSVVFDVIPPESGGYATLSWNLLYAVYGLFYGLDDYFQSVSATAADTTAPSAPGTPSLVIGDDSGLQGDMRTKVDQNIRFTWTRAIDLESGISKYQIKVDNVTGYSDWIDIGIVTSVTLTVNYGVASLENGSYTIRVRAANGRGLLGSENNNTFTIDKTSAPGIQPISPVGQTNTLTPRVSWLASSVSDAWKYRVQITRNDGLLGWPLIYDSTTTSTSVTLPSGLLQWNKEYNAYVAVIDTAGNPAVNGDGRSFSPVDSTGPSQPGIPTLAAGSDTGVMGDARTRNDQCITFNWAASTDGESGVSRYELKVDNVFLNGSLVAGAWVDVGSATSATLTFNGIGCVGAPLVDGTYTVRVRAANGCNVLSSERSSTFTVDKTAPAGIQPSSPVGQTNTLTPTVSWVASGASDAWKYRVQITRNDPPLWWTIYDSTTTATSVSLPSGLLSWNKEYNAYVAVIDAAGNPAVNGDGRSFSPVDSTGPSQPGIPTLAAGSDTGVTGDARTRNDQCITFNWAASTDGESGVSRYEVKVDNVFLNGSLVAGTWVDVGTLTNTTLTFNGDLCVGAPLVDGTYTIRVRAANGCNVLSSERSSTFTVDKTAPAGIQPSSPVGQTNTLTPTVSWTASGDSDAWKYRVQITRNDPPLWCTIYDSTTTATSVSLPAGLLSWNKEYNAYVAVIDTAGNVGDNGNNCNFSTTGGIPLSFSLNTPAANATNQAQRPSFSWGASSGATGYRLEIANNDVFGNPGTITPKYLSNITSWTYDGEPELKTSTSYWWRVVATNSVGSTDCAWRKFTTQPADAIGIQIAQLSVDGKLVAIDYQLVCPQTTSTVSVSFSKDGGNSWFSANNGTLSGTYGSGIQSGNYRITWNAGAQMPSNTCNNNMRVRIVATGGGMSSTNIAPFALDFASAQNVTVEGKVTDAQTKQPIANAMVYLSGKSAQTGPTGAFKLTDVSLADQTEMLVQSVTYNDWHAPVTVVAGNRQIVRDVGMILISDMTNRPVVTGVKSRYEARFFLQSVPVVNHYIPSINWNGTSAGQTKVYINNSLLQTIDASGADFSFDVNTGTDIPPSIIPGKNKLRIIAVSSTGIESLPHEMDINAFPLPWPLSLAFVNFLGLDDMKLKGSINVELPGQSSIIDLGPMGKFGAHLGLKAGAEYKIASGDGKIEFGGGMMGGDYHMGTYDDGQCYFMLLDDKVDIIVAGEVSGNLAKEIDGAIGVALKYKRPLKKISPLEVLPGVTDFITGLPFVGGIVDQILSPVKITIYGTVSLGGKLDFRLYPGFELKKITVPIAGGLELAYEPKISDSCKAKIYCGGELGAQFQYPGDFLAQLTFKVYYGLKVTAFFLEASVEGVVVDLKIPDYNLAEINDLKNSREVILKGKGLPFSPMHRSYLVVEYERFKDYSEIGVNTLSPGQSATTDRLSAFRRIGQAPVTGSVAWLAAGSEREMSVRAPNPGGDTGGSVCQADLPLVENVFPYSEPCLAGVSSNLMLVYVTDNGYTNDLQFTDIKWTRFDGMDWSVPQTILADTRAEFSPKVKFDGNGDAVAVWQRVSNPNFTNVDLTAMAAEMEIVYSRWNSGSGIWSSPVALTTNNFYDGTPLLAGPLSNGDLLLTWTCNEQNLLMGTGAVGAASNDQVLWSQWSAATRSWSLPTVLVSNLSCRTSQDFAGVGDRAVYVWTADMDGVLTNDTDMEVFAKTWNNGVWNEAFQYTTNELPDRTIRVAVSAAGVPYLVWRQDSNLVSAADFSSDVLLARADSATAGFADYALTYGPQGNMALVWQEMSDTGSDAHYSVYDPISGSWSKDMRLFTNSTLERSFAPIWDNVGNLTIAYNAVEMYMTNKTVELEGGGFVTVSNVPESGAVSLALVKRALIQDVALQDGDFTVDGYNYLPYDALTLTACLRNVGDVAVSNPAVAFFDGNPNAGGTLITNLVWTNGWYEGAATSAVLSAVWVVPEPATNHVLYAVANRYGAFTEFSSLNNTQSVVIGGTDLSVSLLSATVESNGSMRVIAQVKNEGAPEAVASLLAIRRQGETGTALGTVDVPLLDPGRLAQVAIDLPAGTAPERDSIYTLFADDTGLVSGDVDTNNNVSSFSVNLWVDGDDDGMPNYWEEENGFSDSNYDDASVDSDGDGMSNMAEFRAGTDPHNAGSYLQTCGVLLPNESEGVEIRWGSVSNRLYSIQRSFSLMQPGSFITVTNHILATYPENVFIDTVPTNASFYYRVVVE